MIQALEEQKVNIEIPKILSKKGRKRSRMKKCTALSWANAIDITESEFNGYLEKLGYQFRNKKTLQWERTPKAIQHSSVIFKKIYWDVDAFFDVLKLQGRTKGTYFYCEKCGTYNKTEDSDICNQCGTIAGIKKDCM